MFGTCFSCEEGRVYVIIINFVIYLFSIIICIYMRVGKVGRILGNTKKVFGVPLCFTWYINATGIYI